MYRCMGKFQNQNDKDRNEVTRCGSLFIYDEGDRTVKIDTILKKVITAIYIGVLAFIFYTIMFKEKMNAAIPANRRNAPSNWIMMIWVAGAILGLSIVFKYVRKQMRINLYKAIFALAVVVYAIQIFILYHIVFYTGWDCGTVRDLSYCYIYEGWMDPRYLSINPNNVFITCITIALLKIFSFLGNFDAMHFALLCCFALMMNLSTCLVAFIGYKLTGNKIVSMIGYFASVILVALSPWMVVPYTDTATVLFPIGILFIYLYREKISNLIIRWFLITAISIFGCFIKPTCIIVFIAILIYSFINVLKTKINWQTLIRSAVGCLIAAAILFPGRAYMEYRLDLDKELNLTWAHFLMMGMNSDAWGVWNFDDFDFSLTIEGKEQRKEADLERVKQRFKEYGVSGTILQFEKKTIVNYNDGSFAWGNEGDFYATPNNNQSPLSIFLKSLFYQNEQGTRYKILYTIEHFCWLLVLVASILIIFDKNADESVKYIILLSLIGIFMFVTLFEARGRYIFNYVPIYILAAVLGINCLYQKICNTERKI